MGLLRERPGILLEQTGEYVRDEFRLTPSALFYRGARVADRDDFVLTIPKSDVIEIVVPAKGASALAVSGAVGGGIFGGMILGVNALFSRCYGNCTGNVVVAIAAMVGVPLAAGLLTAQATRHKPETIYHA